VLIAEVTVNLHRKGAAVFMAEPSAEGWDIDTGFDTPGCEQMPEIMVCDSTHPYNPSSPVHGLLALSNSHDGRVGVCASGFTFDAFEHFPHVWNHRDPANTPVFRAGFSIAAHSQFPFFEITVSPGNF